MRGKHFIAMAILALAPFHGHGQQRPILEDLDRIYKLIPPESIHLHIAAETYAPGDRVWYKLYLNSHGPSRNYVSAVVYIELLSEGQVIIRQKNWCSGRKAFGQIDLPRSLTAGKYFIRAFTSWMQNLGEGTFAEKSILVTPGSQTLITGAQAEAQNKNRQFLSIKDGAVSVVGEIPPACELVAHNQGRILFHQKVDQSESYALDVTGVVAGTSSEIALLSRDGNLVESATYENPPLPIEIKTDKDRYRTRDKFLITTKITDPHGEPLKGNYSISVKKKVGDVEAKPSFTGSVGWPDVSRSVPSPMIPKEVIIYPEQENSLTGIVTDRTKAAPAGDEESLASRIKAAYGIADPADCNGLLELPFDNSYNPNNFVVLPTMEEFLREIIPQAKARTRNGSSTIRIRNNENNQNIFYYRENPLMLIDNRVVQEPRTLLALSPASISRINITWRLETINLSALASLAAHGIIAVYTNTSEAQRHNQQIFKDFVIPSTFHGIDHAVTSQSENMVPDFRNLVYWNPSVDVNYKTSHEGYFSDEVGEFIVDIVGYTEKGHCFRGQKTIFVVY